MGFWKGIRILLRRCAQDCRLSVFSVALLIALALPGVSLGSIVVNEIMVNEPGSETALEWVELYNTGTIGIQLSRYLFVEAGDTTHFADSLMLPAGGFAILSRKPTSKDSSSSFESVWGNASGVWGDASDEDYLVISAKMSLRNAGDSVTLVSLESGFREVITWSISPPDGVTLERINPFKSVSSDNLGYCRDTNGSTPGRVNSLIPPEDDLELLADTLSLRLPANVTEPIVLTVQIRNRGLKRSTPRPLLVYFDRDFSNAISSGDDLDSLLTSAIPPDSVLIVTQEYREPAGRKRLKLRLPADADSSNNSLQFDFGVGSFCRELVINEFVANPGDQLDCEWIELLNQASYSVQLTGLAIGDKSRQYTIGADITVALDERVIICEDSASFRRYYGATACPVIEPSGWNRLDNNGDLIVVTNDWQAISDTVWYDRGLSEGVSWERDEDSLAGSFATLFYPSSDSRGATPCERNSVRQLPPGNDIGFAADGLSIDSHFGVDSVELRIKIMNFGFLQSQPSELRVCDDRNCDDSVTDADLVFRRNIAPIEPNDSLSLAVKLGLTKGEHFIICTLLPDDNDSNNTVAQSFSVGPLTGELIVTEFLANPTGALECEWVEVKNTTGRSLSLHGWRLGDSLRQNIILDSTVIEPEQYAIIAQDSNCFRIFYATSCPVVQPQSWSNLNNSGDAIILLDKYGTISDSLTYLSVGEANRSIELNETDQVDGKRMWYQCTAESGATPCRSNSPRKLPSQHDLGFAVDGLVVTPIAGDDSTELKFKIMNFGILRSLPSELRVLDDRDYDNSVTDADLVLHRDINPIEPGDSLSLAIMLGLTKGEHLIICTLPPDDNDSNNTVSQSFSVGPPPTELIITEFLANPSGALECEWVEVKNITSRSLTLQGWRLGDSLRQNTILDSTVIEPQQYAIITQDSNCFRALYATSCPVVQPQSWSSLNNSGDAIILIDKYGTISDSLAYTYVGEENHSIELNETDQVDGKRMWYTSTAQSGATPCGANSVTGETVTSVGVTLLNRVFAPQMGEQLHYRISCPPATAFNIEVFDLAGRRQFTIARSQTFSSGEYEYSGASDCFGALPVGAYILRVETESGPKYSKKIGFAVAGSK